MAEEYIPGVCNFGGKAEIKRRRNATIGAFVFFVLTAVLLFVFPLPKITRIVLFIPATALAITWQQWYFKFCVFFGIKGLFNFAPRGTVKNIETEAFRKKDMATVWRIFLLGLLFATAVTAAAYFI